MDTACERNYEDERNGKLASVLFPGVFPVVILAGLIREILWMSTKVGELHRKYEKTTI